jgi:putative heme-binding domain-containing protein
MDHLSASSPGRRVLSRLALFVSALALPLAADEPRRTGDDLGAYARTVPGDPGKGRAVFADAQGAGCIRCHKVRGEGGDVGPDLSDVGGKLGREHLIEAVLEPSRQIVEGYRPTVLALADGRVLTGLVQRESEDALTLIDAQTQPHTIRKAEIEERRLADISLMPEGLSATLSPAQFADLIAYLERLRSAPPATPGSTRRGPIVVPEGFTASKVAGGLTGATALAIAPDGRIFVAEQTGALRVVRDGVLLPAPFLTLEVDAQWERGLIGVAVDPAFAVNGFVYVNAVVPAPYPHHRIIRVTARGDVAAPGSTVVLLEGDDQRTLGGKVPAGHQGGALHFGGDGKLYIAIGDQTAGLPAQRLDTFQGKLLRINPDGSIPEDNPFAARTQGKYCAIWALGLRNPFSFAVQPGTGRIFVNDVGQNAWEEIDEAFAGANYGWPAAEGASGTAGFQDPLHTYKAASIAGGAFCPYRAGPDDVEGFPAEYRGKYFFMDFVQGWVNVLDPGRPTVVRTFATGLARPVDLAFAPDGSLYVLLRDAWVIDARFQRHTGSLWRIRSAPAGPGDREQRL